MVNSLSLEGKSLSVFFSSTLFPRWPLSLRLRSFFLCFRARTHKKFVVFGLSSARGREIDEVEDAEEEQRWEGWRRSQGGETDGRTLFLLSIRPPTSSGQVDVSIASFLFFLDFKRSLQWTRMMDDKGDKKNIWEQ